MDVVGDVDDDDGARTRILGIRRRPRRRLLALARGDISFTSGWCAPEFALYAATGVFFLVAIFLVNVLEFGHLSHIISTYFCLVK